MGPDLVDNRTHLDGFFVKTRVSIQAPILMRQPYSWNNPITLLYP